jgi:hypothetical protein
MYQNQQEFVKSMDATTRTMRMDTVGSIISVLPDMGIRLFQ